MRTLHAFLPAAVFGCLLTASPAYAADGEDTPINASGDAAASAHAVGGGSIVRTILALAIVLAIIYGLYWVLKNVKAAKAATASGGGLETLATLPLGTDRALHLVRAGREVVLIGTADGAIAPIRRYSEEEAAALGLVEPPALTVGATLESLEPPKGFLDVLRSKTVVK
ncbi:MAG TPA: flagellar biosynthetic protein FliO [Solirubrobacter sp.]|nr:flagellar biosynthetic protein FliO [Solirubrobacter sp.]